MNLKEYIEFLEVVEKAKKAIDDIRKEDLEDDEENLCAYCLHGLCADVCKECLGLNWK